MTAKLDGAGQPKKRAVIYVRTAAHNDTTDGQEQTLRTFADQIGLTVVAVYCDQGMAATGKRRRLGLDAMLRGAADGRFDCVLALSLHHLGRTLDEILATVSKLRLFGVSLCLQEDGIDTSTETGRAFFDTAAILDHARKALIRERVIAGQRRAKQAGVRIGRPPVAASKLTKVRQALESGEGIRAAARAGGVSPAMALRLKRGLEAERGPD